MPPSLHASLVCNPIACSSTGVLRALCQGMKYALLAVFCTCSRRRSAPVSVAWIVATLRSTLVLSTFGMLCRSARLTR
jgi:hypothetical protein